MFIKENKTVDLVVYYKKQGMHYIAYGKKDFENRTLSDKERDDYKIFTLQMRVLTWGLYNELQEGAAVEGEDGNKEFNYRKYKELRLVKLIESWDATSTNDKGEVIPVDVNEKIIKSLAPEIAETILTAYDELMYLSEKEEKK